MPDINVPPVFCPRCDRQKPNMTVLKEHVMLAHPDHDPEWADDEETTDE